jgi:hypothetical protein
MITFLFWNLNKKPLQTTVARLALQHHVDVLILAECETAPVVMLKTLNRKNWPIFHFPLSYCDHITIYTRFASEFIQPLRETSRISIRRLMLPARTEILLAAVHLPSRYHLDRADLRGECAELSTLIREVEKDVGHAKTVLVGDMNTNPFEDGLVEATTLHAVMTRGIALRRRRRVQSRQYPFFYNPMWSHFGDATEGPPGTYYYPGTGHLEFFWHIFDQVLLRPDLLDCFRNEDLKIISSDGTRSFLTAKGLPDKTNLSDHLPILFRLNL